MRQFKLKKKGKWREDDDELHEKLSKKNEIISPPFHTQLNL
jgi:hypothetical protein